MSKAYPSHLSRTQYELREWPNSKAIVDQVEKTSFGAPAIAVIGAVVNLHSILRP